MEIWFAKTTKPIKMTPHLRQFSDNYATYRPSTLKNLFILLAALIQAKTVSLYELRNEVGKINEKCQSSPLSHYKRITRFFTKESKSSLWISVLEYGCSLLRVDRKIFYLDATEWCIGTFRLHCLVLAFHFQNIAVPVYFQLYEHKGVLSEEERIKFIKSAHQFLCLTGVILLADREFIGEKWFAYLDDLSIKFVIRIRKGQYKNDTKVDYNKLKIKALNGEKASTLLKVEKHSFRLWILKNVNQDQSEPLIYILTNLTEDQQAPAYYRLRWKIETLFKHLKTNGYNLEDLRMTNLDKIRLLISIVILAYILSVLMGREERKEKKVRKKRYKNKTVYEAISLFKEGYSLLKQAFTTLTQFMKIIQFLTRPLKIPVT